MLVEQIDTIYVQSLQRAVDRLANAFRPAVGAGGAAIGPKGEAELGGNDDLVAPTRDGLADEFFVLERPVDLGRVEKVHAQFDGFMNDRDGFGLVAAAVSPAHSHAAKSEGGYRQSLRTEFSLFHDVVLFGRAI